MVVVISFMLMVFFIILHMDNNEDVRVIDEHYQRYLDNRKKDKFLKEIEKYDKSKTSKSRRR